MIKSIVAIERDGLDVRTLTMVFEIINSGIVLKDAIRNAVADFMQTDEGKEIYDYNCSCFNWADFWNNVPNTFCEKHGFRKMNEIISKDNVDWDEQLF